MELLPANPPPSGQVFIMFFSMYLCAGSRTDASEKCSDEDEDCEPVPSFQSAFTHALMSADLNLNVADGKILTLQLRRIKINRKTRFFYFSA